MIIGAIEDYVAQCLQLATLLEVSAYPKPGNVHRTRDFSDTRFEHFLASAVALGPCWREAARRGILISSGKLKPSGANVGGLIKTGVERTRMWHTGGNTSLGTIMLLAPMAVAAGSALESGELNEGSLRGNLRLIVKASTPLDAVNVYEAISLANPGGLGKVEELDARDPSSRAKILERGATLLKVFELASSRDSIAFEWVNDFKITFEVGYPFFVAELESSKDLNASIVNTFLKLLSEIPDSLIARKAGAEEALMVSNKAKEALEAGGLRTAEGRRMVAKLDEELSRAGNKLNPGTTADLISSILAVAVLNGLRP